MKRLFIAVPIREQTRNEIVNGIFKDEAIRKLPVRWTAYQNLHLTLQFLGDTEEKRIPEIKRILDSLPRPASPVSLSFTTIGTFPNRDSARIIWLGMKKCDYLLNTQKTLTDLLNEKGFPVDRKRFKAHLTLGRVRDNAQITPEAFEHLEQLTQSAHISDSPIDKITLYESILRPGGPIYTAIFEKSLIG